MKSIEKVEKKLAEIVKRKEWGEESQLKQGCLEGGRLIPSTLECVYYDFRV